MTRYSITAEFHDNAKARLRTSLKLLGALSVRIVELEEAQAKEPVRPDNLPSTPEAKAIADIYNRKHTQPWQDDEIAAFRKLRTTGILTLENIAMVADYYKIERKKPEHFCRTSVLRLIRYFPGELDKARADKPKAGKALEWAQPENVVPMTDPAEAERIATAAREAAARFREGMGR